MGSGLKLVLACAAALLFLLPASPGLARVVDGVVASVNDEPITFSEVRDAVAESMGVPTGDADSYLREERDKSSVLRWIEPLVESVLVRKELGKAGMGVEESEIDGAVAAVRKRNNLSETEFAQALARDGITIGAYRRRLRWQMERGNIVRSRKMKEVSVTEEEVRSWYRENVERFMVGSEVRLSTLLIPFPEGGGEAESVSVRIAVQQTAEMLRAGRTLPEIGAALSLSHAGVRVVDAEFLPTDGLSQEMESQVRRLRTGETSQPFLSEEGARVVSVAARRGGIPKEFSEVRESLIDELTDRRSEKAYADLLFDMKKGAAIDIRL